MKDTKGYHKIKGREGLLCWWNKDVDKHNIVFLPDVQQQAL